MNDDCRLTAKTKTQLDSNRPLKISSKKTKIKIESVMSASSHIIYMTFKKEASAIIQTSKS